MNKLLKAIAFATEVHTGQTRKQKPHLPYITHPLGVGLLLSQSGASEDIVIAGILHDTIEDCEPQGSVTKEIIAQEYGEHIAEMVNAVTEQDRTLPWTERKQQALDHIQHMHKDSLQVKSADLLHNMTELVADYKKDGDTVFEKFNAPKEAQMERFRKLLAALEKADLNLPLLPQLKETFAELG